MIITPPGDLKPVFVPFLPQRAVRVSAAAGEGLVTGGGAAVHHNHLVHRVVHDLLHLGHLVHVERGLHVVLAVDLVRVIAGV